MQRRNYAQREKGKDGGKNLGKCPEIKGKKMRRSYGNTCREGVEGTEAGRYNYT